jgi:tripeptide aminopeptidase
MNAVLQTFLEMVRIDSPSGEEEAMRLYLEKRLSEHLIPFKVDKGGNLIADVPGNQCSHTNWLMLSGHMDVVPPCLGVKPVVTQEDGDTIITSDNTTVLGADDKAGLALILEMVIHSLNSDLPRPPIRLLFTTREEISLLGAKDVEPEDLKGVGFSVILDHTGDQGTIIHQAPALIEIQIECIGKAVHAGIQPEDGINAITLASRIINRFPVGRLDPDTTANIGTIEGGRAINVVPDRVKLIGEIRSHNPAIITQELDKLRQAIAEEMKAMPGSSVELKLIDQFPAYRVEPDHPGVQKVVEAARQAGLTPNLIRTNGGSDNNIFVNQGIPGVVLSACYIDPHSRQERVRMSEMTQGARFLLSIMEQFAHDSV